MQSPKSPRKAMVAAKVLQGSSEHGDAGDVPEAAT